MAASMGDVFSFCVGVAGKARVAVEVRFVSSAKVRPRQSRREPPLCPAMETATWDPRPGAWKLLCCSDSAARSLLAARGLPVCPRAKASGGVTRWIGSPEVSVRSPFPRNPERPPAALLPPLHAGPG